MDLRRSSLSPVYDFSVVPNLVYSGSGADVTFAMVDGRVLMRDRVITFVDERALIARAQACGERLLQRVPYRLRPRWPVLARHGPGVTLTPSPASGARDAAP